jgi:hypothetical protein
MGLAFADAFICGKSLVSFVRGISGLAFYKQCPNSGGLPRLHGNDPIIRKQREGGVRSQRTDPPSQANEVRFLAIHRAIGVGTFK